MISADLTGKRTIVTGGVSGIGLSVVRTFAQNGSTVAMADLADGQIGESALALVDDGPDVFEAPCDLRDNDSVIFMIDSAAEQTGGIDYPVNIAGHPVMLTASPASDLESQTEELWSEVLSINLISAFRTAKAAAPYLRGSQGAIVNTSAMSGWRGGGSSPPYSMAKDGIVTLTKELGCGLGPEVRVNAISPSYVHPDSTNFPPRWESVFEDCEALPLGRLGTAVEYADACLFLCAGASYITGQNIHGDGGWSG
ncbi:MAG: SDR family oxidoreductase [Acidimicrobiaceae bacterium]|jgi:3-oxoacyl-[acyl-carrier protein] reductase|nr:SDR family oxidoreductase [Acidimicrobiaceae bacterium]MBT5579626.1 SDR family oxidoreductase [Acidimicrobiaceae bacterium]